MLVDSNIIIYAAKSEHDKLRRFIAEHAPAVSAVSYVEVLGYHKLSEIEKHFFAEFFTASRLLPLSQEILDHAVKLRQQRKMSLGDSLVAATALVSERTLVTRNTKDFAWIPNLNLLDPFQLGDDSLTKQRSGEQAESK